MIRSTRQQRQITSQDVPFPWNNSLIGTTHWSTMR